MRCSDDAQKRRAIAETTVPEVVTISSRLTCNVSAAAVIQSHRLARAPSLTAIRTYAAEEVKSLAEELRGLEKAPPYEVRISESLRALAAEVDRFIDRAMARH